MASTKPKATSIAKAFISEILRNMKERGLSQVDVAARLGCSRSYVNKLLRGEQNLTLATQKKLAEALDLKLVVTVERVEISGSQTQGKQGHGRNSKDQPSVEAGDLVQRLTIDNTADARAFLDTCGRDARQAIYSLIKEEASEDGRGAKRGRKAGSGVDCRPQMHYIAELLVGENPPSERKASLLAATWAAEQRMATDGDSANRPKVLSAETLRTRFRKNRPYYLAQARRALAQRQDNARARAANDGRLVIRTSSSRVSARVCYSALSKTALSSLASVDEELKRIASRFSWSSEALDLLRRPGMLEEIGRLIRSDEVLAAATPLPIDATAPMAKLSRLVEEPFERMHSIIQEFEFTSAWSRLNEQAAASSRAKLDEFLSPMAKLHEVMMRSTAGYLDRIGR